MESLRCSADFVYGVVTTNPGIEEVVGDGVGPDGFVTLPVAVDPGHTRAVAAQDNRGVREGCAVGVSPTHLDDLSALHPVDREGLKETVNVWMAVPSVVVAVLRRVNFTARGIEYHLLDPLFALHVHVVAQVLLGPGEDQVVTPRL